MEKISSEQLELFSKRVSPVSAKATSGSFLRRILGYEKAILIIIGFIITAVVSFSLGIERGKDLAASKANLHLDEIVGQKVQQPKTENLKQDAPKPIYEDDAVALASRAATRPFTPDAVNYTIQLASYKTNAYAQKEAQLLKKKGLVALVLPKGAYTIVCVGRFSDKQTAKTLLVELQKKYKGCFIRRL